MNEQSLLETVNEHIDMITRYRIRDYIGELYQVCESVDAIDEDNFAIDIDRGSYMITLRPRVAYQAESDDNPEMELFSVFRTINREASSSELLDINTVKQDGRYFICEFASFKIDPDLQRGKIIPE